MFFVPTSIKKWNAEWSKSLAYKVLSKTIEVSGLSAEKLEICVVSREDMGEGKIAFHSFSEAEINDFIAVEKAKAPIVAEKASA